MINLIDYTYFKGPLLIANTAESTYVQADVTAHITSLQKEFLVKLLGTALYAAFEAWYAATPGDTTSAYYGLLNGKIFTHEDVDYSWQGFINAEKVSPLASYVYYHFQRDNYTQTVSTGEANTNAQNADKASPSDKMVSAWNGMVDMLCGFYFYMEEYFADNANWEKQRLRYSELYYRINAFNI